MTETVRPKNHGVLAPMILVLATLVLWFGFQTSQLMKERENLKVLRANQETIYGNAQKMRSQLDAIASGTAQLAQQGNPNAKIIVDELRKRDITINTNATSKPAAH